MAKNIDYPKFISTKRIPIAPPDNLVDKDGKFILGTFNAPFKNLNMLDASKPLGFPMARWFKKLRIKDWEALEVNFDEGFLVSAIYSLGIIAFNIIIFYDYATKKNSVWHTFSTPGKISNHHTLINSVKEFNIGENSHLKFKNNFEKGHASFSASAKNDEFGKALISLELQSISTPSNVSIPFAENKALYSHKEFFKVSGEVKLGERVLTSNENTVGIIDDHKGYYPYHMHYYWITGMGTQIINDKKCKLAFNLTQNQTIDAYNYNENLLWLEGVSYPLPPVKFTIQDNYWEVKDEFGMVDIKFFIEGSFATKLNALVIRANYYAPFGRYEGFIKDYSGNVYNVAGLSSMGEDKTYIM